MGPLSASPRLRRRLPLALLLALCAATLPLFLREAYEPSEETNDASLYILTAKSLLAGEGYSYLGEPFIVRPPGMSLLIAPVLALRGFDPLALHLLVSLFGVACVALLFALWRPRLGAPLAFAVAAALWLSPPFQQMCNRVLSDVPGAALLLACLLVERWARREPSWRRDALLGLLIGLSAYVRSLLVLLVPAIVAARALEHLLRREAGWLRLLRARLLVVVVVPALVLMPWQVRNRLEAPEPPAHQTYLYDYATAQWRADAGDPASPRVPLAAVAARVPERGEQMLALLGTRLAAVSAGPAALAAGALVALLALAAAARRREPAELFWLGAGAVLAVYFAFAARLFLPLFVLVWPAALETLRDLLARVARPRAATGVVLALVAVLAARDLGAPRGDERVRQLDALYRSTYAPLSRALPPDARVGAGVGWHASLYLERPVYSLAFAGRRGAFRSVQRLIDRLEIDVLVLNDLIPTERALLQHYRARYPVIARTEHAVALRVQR